MAVSVGAAGIPVPFLPRILGIWLAIACFAWMAFGLTGLLFPAREDTVYSITQPFVLGEVVTMLWLVIIGARLPKPAMRSQARPPA